MGNPTNELLGPCCYFLSGWVRPVQPTRQSRCACLCDVDRRVLGRYLFLPLVRCRCIFTKCSDWFKAGFQLNPKTAMTLKSALIFFILSVGGWTSAIGFQEWDVAIFLYQSETKDPMLVRCHYQTTTGFEFSIIQRLICPAQVYVNPETGVVKKTL